MKLDEKDSALSVNQENKSDIYSPERLGVKGKLNTQSQISQNDSIITSLIKTQ